MPDDRFSNPLKDLEQKQVTEKKQQATGQSDRRGPRYTNPLEDVGAEAIKSVYSESARAGDYYRHTFTWSPQQLAMIKKIAEELEVSMNAAARWLMDQGLRQYVHEGKRPELEVKDVRREPRLEDW